MKVAFVVQRFGPGVEGGAEWHCAQVARRIAEQDNVRILTSTVLHAGKWHQNHFPVGDDEHKGLAVTRFATDSDRGPLGIKYGLHVARNRLGSPSAAQQRDWVDAHGPRCPGLMQHLEEHGRDYDAFVFFTYLYHPTVVGLPKVADRAVLIPTAHDEPELHLPVFGPMFRAPRVILYNTEEERALVQRVADNASVPSILAGVGIDDPPQGEPEPADKHEDIVFIGRISNKKVGDLFSHFKRYASTRPKARLILVGKAYRAIPKHPRILAPGFVPEAEKWRWLRRARVFVMPSKYESLSVVLLEAWSVGAPALVNQGCDVLAGHVSRSGGGLTYTGYDEFADAMNQLLDAPEKARSLGRLGAAYVREHYRWADILPRIRHAIEYAAGRRDDPPTDAP